MFYVFALQNTRAIASRGRQTPRKQCLPSPYQGAEHPLSTPYTKKRLFWLFLVKIGVFALFFNQQFGKS